MVKAHHHPSDWNGTDMFENRGTGMNCVNCGREGVFHRLAIDRGLGREVGAYCQVCEDDDFDELVNQGFSNEAGNCGMCDRDGLYALPLIDLLIESESGDETSLNVEYEITAETPLLCDEHFHLLTVRDETSPVSKRPTLD